MLAFTFPGQGSQQPGMGRPWVGHPAWALVETASTASGRDVAALLLDADADGLRRTENAQLATYVLSLVVHDAARALGLRCAVAAGHSLGEYSALTAVGAMSLEDGVRLVAARGAPHRSATQRFQCHVAAHRMREQMDFLDVGIAGDLVDQPFERVTRIVRALAVIGIGLQLDIAT